jgi:tetratricopeptide (TPR) repeat protein
MTIVKRLRLLTAILGSAAACVVIGTVIGEGYSSKSAPAARTSPDSPKLIDELAKTKFSDRPTLAYKLKSGKTAFAWQLKPALAATDPRPKDVLVMVDTSASQAGEPLARAAQIVNALSHDLKADDRVDVWTVNLDNAEHTRSLTRGFKSAADKSIRQAAEKLTDTEYAAGAVDMKSGLQTVIKQFEGKAGRQQVILYLGDGESAVGTPLTESVRVDLGKRMVESNIQFFSVPLGTTIAANTLHGFGMLTGGAVVRVKEDLVSPSGRFTFSKRLTDSFDVPVIIPNKVVMNPAGGELFPGQLPPLRADRTTLVVGTLSAETASLNLKVDGTVSGRQTSMTLTESLPAAQSENYFVSAMLEQWRSAPTADAPVVLSADRALAMASEQFRLYRDEFLVLAIDAITANRLDHAEKLFAAAANIDPDAVEAKAGVKLIAKLRSGEVSKDQLKKQVGEDEKAGRKLIVLQQPPAAEGTVPPAAPAAPAANLPAESNNAELLKQAEASRAVAEAEARAIVDETLKRARRLRETDPDGAYDDLKRQRETIRSIDRLSDSVRTRLVADLEASMRDVAVKSADIKRRLSAERARISEARERLNEYDRQLSQDEQTKARIDRFRFLMNQARFELAYREAQVMEQERVNRGLPVPPEVYATYRIGQSATQLREQREMKRLREDRYLLTMMQVDKSFVPYPDEPPVHFPPASVWRELRGRREVYEFKNQVVGSNVPQSLRTYQSILESTHSIPGLPKRVKFDNGVKGTNLKQLVETLETQFQKQIKFVIREDLFRQAGPDFADIKEKQFTNDGNLTGMTLGSFLDVVLLDLRLSYIVRPEYIEITTMEARIDEKVTRALEIGDLAFAAPNSVNQQALQQNLNVFGAQLNFFGQGIGQAQQFGQLGNGGGFGGGGGGFGGGGGGQGGQLGGGQFGQLGGGGGAQGGGQFGQQGGQQNLGVGGGILGVTGGQLGQFGNLGGQFGIQGNNQSQVLIQVISQLVARGEWDVNFAGVGQPPQDPDSETPTVFLKPYQLNSLGYYPVANALIVRATGRYHPTQSFKLPIDKAGGAAQAPDGRGNRRAAANPNVMEQVGGMVGKAELNNPVTDGNDVIAKAGKDPKKIWNATFDKAVTDPQLVVDVTDILFEYKEYQHAAESLKANLRKGRATGAWAYEALTIALQSSQATPAEVERAAISGIDLEPNDPRAYLQAAKAENDLGRSDLAISLCKRAAEIEPNLPLIYANALVYAEKHTEVRADVVGWATENLLRRDWPNDGTDYASDAKRKVARISKQLISNNRKEEAELLNRAVSTEKTRDLMVRLAWQGQGDLDLTVSEPSGTVCDASCKRTTGGGVLVSDIMEQENDNRSEVYTAAEAFTGTYKVKVKTALGRAIGNKAQLVVTMFAGSDHPYEKLFDVDLNSDKEIEFTLDGGSRSDLATVMPEEMSQARLTASGVQIAASTGVSAGVGGVDAVTMDMVNTASSSKSISPLVSQSQEVRLPSISAALPSFRLTGKIAGGGSKAEYVGTPVFVGKAVDIPMPKVQLLPGSGR